VSNREVESPSPVISSSSHRFLPPIGTRRYYLFLGAVAIFILGPLAGVTAAYMNFSLGFFVGGQVLAGILGSVVTYAYGPEGKHGANYMQTMAASVSGMCAMGVLVQAMTWLGIEPPSTWQLILYFACIGMFGVGVGMLYTPILVDRLQLAYPSGLAVANILRALTDKTLLKRSIAKLGGGTAIGIIGGFASQQIASLDAISLSTSTIGAGMVVGVRIALPALVVATIGKALTPYLQATGWLGPHDPFRKIGFLFALGTIMGAAVVDLSLIFRQAIARVREKRNEAEITANGDVSASEAWKQTNMPRLISWVVFWGVALIVVAVTVMKLPLGFVLVAVALVFLFVMINGIAMGISDSNPISSAFVITVLIMAALGLRSPGVGLMAAAILLISTTTAVDMQQDRSTGWRLGSNRVIQFRYQVVGVLMGAVLAVYMAKLFMNAYPVLKIDTFQHPEAKAAQWQSAMTYKFVGALRALQGASTRQVIALTSGLGAGLVIEIARKFLAKNEKYQAFKKRDRNGYAIDFIIDVLIIPSPYASSFGGFVNFMTALWFSVGGVVSSLMQVGQERKQKASKETDAALPEDMSTTSLIGGGLIAGDSIAALVLGIWGLLSLFK
jgi:uncharacterized oligopeptide transporter (OPT) family protein